MNPIEHNKCIMNMKDDIMSSLIAAIIYYARLAMNFEPEKDYLSGEETSGGNI
uniref:Uncharacterized protein n=1 Tax=Rhizophagus irregularis (strain DAOM 181602 / DAOM 197198 / MUCL 43194) TaxID=747089 RepID=U9UE39_RHIID